MSDESSEYQSSSSGEYTDDEFPSVAAASVPPPHPDTQTVDANVAEVKGRSKSSPPPTPRVRGNAFTPRGGVGSVSSRGSTPRTFGQPTPRSGGCGVGSASMTPRGVASPRSASSGGGSRGPTPRGWGGAGAGASTYAGVVVLYTASGETKAEKSSKTLKGKGRPLRERCRDVRAALVALGVDFLERDVSMRESHAEELETRLGERSSAPGGIEPGTSTPALFADDETVAIGVALEDLASDHHALRGALAEAVTRAGAKARGDGRGGGESAACRACGGTKLVACFHCDGSMRILMRDASRGVDVERRCPWCNEVGMQECAECG